MRLIDADELEDRMLRYYGDYSFNIWEEIRDFFRNTPTVKAIPIEYIEKRLRKAVAFTHSKAEGDIISDGCVVEVVSASFTANVLFKLLEAWEKEK